MRTKVSVDDYEAAERDFLIRRARRLWRLHAVAFGLALAALVLVELLTSGTSWLAYVAFAVWAVVLGLHYRRWVSQGDERIREQQFRIEWRADRANERVLARR